jgi:hypothetical protein
MCSPWPFHTWGLDLLGSFNAALGQLKYLLVAVDYFTKWIEAEPSSTIVFRKTICYFTIPAAIVTDNETQFTGKAFHKMQACL